MSRIGRSTAAPSEIDAFLERYTQRSCDAVRRADVGDLKLIAPTTLQEWSGGAVLCLGGWCLPPAGLSAAFLPNPWDDRDGVPLFEEECWRLARWVLDGISPRLNDAHEEQRPARYWELLVAPWLLHAVSVVVERYVRTLAASAISAGAPFAVAPALTPPATGDEALGRYIEDAGNLDLFSHIVGLLGLPADSTARSPSVANEAGEDADAGHLARLRLAARNRAALWRNLDLTLTRLVHGRRRGRRILVLAYPGITAAQVARLRRGATGLRVGSARELTISPSVDMSGITIDWNRRTRLVEGLEGRNGAERVVAGLLPALIPMSLIEGYQRVCQASRARYGEACPVVMGNYYTAEVQNEFIARVGAAGDQIAFAQHGGSYRQSRVDAMERLEYRPDGRFLSWGWEGPGATVAPSPRLSRLRDTHRGGDDVLLVEVQLPRYLVRFNTWPLAEQGEALPNDLAAFVCEASSRGLGERLALKPATDGDAYGRVRSPIVAELRRVDLLRSSYAADWMQRARVAVLTYPATAFIESMVIGVPLIALWDRAVWEERDDARAHFEALEALGVLFRDPVLAAARLSEIYDYANEWWHGPEIQSQRLAFLHRFARTDRWREAWTRSLEALVEGGHAPPSRAPTGS